MLCLFSILFLLLLCRELRRTKKCDYILEMRKQTTINLIINMLSVNVKDFNKFALDSYIMVWNVIFPASYFLFMIMYLFCIGFEWKSVQLYKKHVLNCLLACIPKVRNVGFKAECSRCIGLIVYTCVT